MCEPRQRQRFGERLERAAIPAESALPGLERIGHEVKAGDRRRYEDERGGLRGQGAEAPDESVASRARAGTDAKRGAGGL